MGVGMLYIFMFMLLSDHNRDTGLFNKAILVRNEQTIQQIRFARTDQ
ncbi:hypothetical protein HPSAT_00155 [Helicobacter pylori Sat464]|nr:hypothetical protein HPSAT_00155 [Helicobacter pylori Sat464]